MPVVSYLAFGNPDSFPQLVDALARVPRCEVTPSTTHPVAVVVAETDQDRDEFQIQKEIEACDLIQGLAMVAAYSDDAYFGGEV